MTYKDNLVAGKPAYSSSVMSQIKRYGMGAVYFTIVVTTFSAVFFSTMRWKATAQTRIEARIIATHNDIVAKREQKKADCALIDNFPKSLLGICF